MSVQDILKDLDEDIDRVIEEIHAIGKDNLTDEQMAKIQDASTHIIATMQEIEDKLSNLLAEYGIEIGDERID